MMYESFFGLKQRPFSAAPDPGCWVPVEAMQQTVAALGRCAEDCRGIGVLTAPAGMGKTLLLQRLLGEMDRAFATLFLANSNFSTRRSLLQAMLYELGQPYLRMGEQELRLELISSMRALRPEKRALVIAVDEAHLLNAYLLEEIRSITNLIDEGEPLVRVVLGGQLSLEEKLADSGFDAFNQRIGCQETLAPLTRQESREFIVYRMQWAGANADDVFSADALQAICHAADGVPRCINQLCHHALLLAYVAGTKPVDRATVTEALDDLKQLPLHWNEPLSPPAVRETDTPPRTEDETPETDGHVAETEAAATNNIAAIEVGAGEAGLNSVDPFDEPQTAYGANVVEVGSDCEPVGADVTDEGVVPNEAEPYVHSSPAAEATDDDNHSEPDEEPEVIPDFWLPDGDGWVRVPLNDADAPDGWQYDGSPPRDDFITTQTESYPTADDDRDFDEVVVPNERERASTGDGDHGELCGYEEELVVDRYAMLDAHQRSKPPGEPIGGFVGDVTGEPYSNRSSAECIIDSVSPMIDEALHTDWRASEIEAAQPGTSRDKTSQKGDCSVPFGGVPLEETASTSESTQAELRGEICETASGAGGKDRICGGYDNLSNEAVRDIEVEEEIGSSVLETCLETQEAICNRFVEAEPPSQRQGCDDRENDGNKAVDAFATVDDETMDDSLPFATEYDIVEPEGDAARGRDSEVDPDGSGSPQQAAQQPSAMEPSPPRHYERLFSELRRRSMS